MCHVAQENRACTHNVSILTRKTKRAFVALCSLDQIRPNLLCRCWHIGREHKVNRASRSFNISLHKVAHFLRFFFLFFFLFAHLQKSAIKHKRISDCLHIWHTLKGIQGTYWHQIWFKYEQNWQNYKWFFMKIDTNMLSHLQGKPIIISNKQLKIGKWIV